MKTFLTAALAAIAIATPAHAAYEHKVDRFNGRVTSSWTGSQGCSQTKALKGRVYTCLLINSTESSSYPTLNFMKVNDGWELMHYGRSLQAPGIITYKNGTSERVTFDANLTTRVLSGGSVAEWVGIPLRSYMSKMDSIAKIEVQYGSAELEYVPGPEAVCVMQQKPAC